MKSIQKTLLVVLFFMLIVPSFAQSKSQLRDRIMELTKQFNELKKKYESAERILVAQEKGENAVIQE